MTRSLRAATDTLRELAAIYAALLLFAATAFMLIENQPFLDSFYWAGTTATSTGYGDISPKTWSGKILAIVVMHASIFVVAPMIVVRLIDRLNEDRDAFTHEEQLAIMVRLEALEGAVRELSLQMRSGEAAPRTREIETC